MNPILALIITNIIWGIAAPIFKLALTNIPPFTLAFLRFFIGSFLILPFAVKNWRKIDLKLLGEICLGGLFSITINIAFFFLGIQRTQSINAPVIASSQPIFLYLFAILFLKEIPKKRVLMGIIISFVGVLIILMSPFLATGKINFIKELAAFEGNLFLLIATLGAVGHTLIFKNILKKVDHLQATYISFLFGALTFLPLMINDLRTWSFTSLNINGWVGIIFGVFFCSTLAYVLFNYGISKIAAQEVGIFSYIDPVAAVLLAVPLLHEIPSLYFYLGSVFVFGGIFLSEGRIQYHPFHRIRKYKTISFNERIY
jgi:drug/metabolite transporter (DMT)-like permease